MSCGVTPLATEMFGVTVPQTMVLPVELEATPSWKCVMVSVPPVAAGIDVNDVRLMVLVDCVKPVAERRSATRTYEVYVLSLVV